MPPKPGSRKTAEYGLYEISYSLVSYDLNAGVGEEGVSGNVLEEAREGCVRSY